MGRGEEKVRKEKDVSKFISMLVSLFLQYFEMINGSKNNVHEIFVYYVSTKVYCKLGKTFDTDKGYATFFSK